MIWLSRFMLAAQAVLALGTIWVARRHLRVRRLERRVAHLVAQNGTLQLEIEALREDHDALLLGVQDMSRWDRARARPPLQ